MRFPLIFFLVLFMAESAWSADTMVNIPATPEKTEIPAAINPEFIPGATVILPDGRPTVIQSMRSDGQWLTDIGVVLSPAGIIAEGPQKGQSVIVAPGAQPAEQPAKPEKDGAAPTPLPEKNEPARSQAANAQPDQQEERGPAGGTPAAPATLHEKPEGDAPLTIVELLPMTAVPAESAKEDSKIKENEKPAENTRKSAPPASETRKNTPRPAKPEAGSEKKVNPKAPHANREQKNQEAKKQTRKAKPGEELHIPPEAARTGSLTFLEGCWEGTRPEYYSKRTIKECFCFGANGKNGKRRLYDSIGHRQCIGSSSATLSSSGVLSVTSSGAVCNDGERWGQAEMICRNTGPRTPCSWVFRDAQNGRQSYEIPFIRVESCGR